MFLSPPFQVLTFKLLTSILIDKIKKSFLHHVAVRLLSLNVLASATSLYVCVGLTTGQWTAYDNGISPLRWLASLAVPTMLASRGLKNGSLTTSGSIAVLFVGFILTIANISFVMCFAGHLLIFETKKAEKLLKKETYPRSFFQIICETGLAIQIAIFHLIEVGVGWRGLGMRGPEAVLDFRQNFTQTWLAINIIGSFAVDVGNSQAATFFKSSMTGAFIGFAYFIGVILSCGLSSLSNNPNQFHIIAIGLFGGICGAICSEILLLVIYGGVDQSTTSDARSRQNFHLKIVSSVVCGIMLPRIVFAMDSLNFKFWNYYFSLSGNMFT